MKVAQEAEHARAAHEATKRAELLRRVEIILAARRKTAQLAAALAEARKPAKESLAAGATLAKAMATAKKAVAQAERITKALAALRGGKPPPPKDQAHAPAPA